MPLSLRFSARDVRVLDSTTAYQGHFALREVTLQHRLFNGGWSEPVQREIFERGDAVGVLPYDPVEDSVILVEQFRPGAMRGDDSPWMLELVAGVVDSGDDNDEQVARREAREEAGCELAELCFVGRVFPSAGACSEQVRLFCGRLRHAAVGTVQGLDHENEDILVHAIPRREALDLLAAGEITNGHTVIALQWLQIHGEQLRQRWS